MQEQDRTPGWMLGLALFVGILGIALICAQCHLLRATAGVP